ncbi:hypothetical protein R3P38DRAFT_2951899 [Favolaschia claudopus]|uniref:Uncharacterized protein n=1 Tax=Favolaschia claudopus TaxID=2862362 RepID=A0AAW0BEB2_9AGAR
MPDDVFLASPRKIPSNRRSTASLRGTLDGGGEDAAGANGRFSLAHELAVAMMPEPSAGSKLLAEEFGIEFDEGAEGIDEPPSGHLHINIQDDDSNTRRINDSQPDTHLDDSGPLEPPDFGGEDAYAEVDPAFGSPTRRRAKAPPENQDFMEVLAENLASTDNLLAHLRRLDADSAAHPSTSSHPTSSSSSQPELERLASDVIRRINETARDREGQLRELLECEREFRRIAGEVGGEDVLGRLDALPVPEPDPAPPPPLGSIPEDAASASASPVVRPLHMRAFSQDWEMDPDVGRLGDSIASPDTEMDPAYDDPPASPPAATASSQVTTSFSRSASSTSASELASLRTLTTSLVSSLTSVSEHAQVNGAATAEAGRKLRALRNRLGGWRTEWEGAERSRGRIERWEAGEAWEGGGSGAGTPGGTPVRGHTKWVDARKVVQEHLVAFELALAEAAVKTQAIMAAS